jgi:mannose/cellobiose epimerase-like protein (N-acyl-D-glucosamine 2-epimerase family)
VADRALRIVERLIRPGRQRRVPVTEHFDGTGSAARLQPRQPADGFPPYGTTPGHAFEWARLLLHLEAARLRPTCHAEAPDAPKACSAQAPAATPGTPTGSGPGLHPGLA